MHYRYLHFRLRVNFHIVSWSGILSGLLQLFAGRRTFHFRFVPLNGVQWSSTCWLFSRSFLLCPSYHIEDQRGCPSNEIPTEATNCVMDSIIHHCRTNIALCHGMSSVVQMCSDSCVQCCNVNVLRHLDCTHLHLLEAAAFVATRRWDFSTKEALFSLS